MSNFAMSIDLFMTQPVYRVSPSATLPEVSEVIRRHRVSSMLVVDNASQPVGVVSRTDLLRQGRDSAGGRPEAKLLSLPHKAVSEVMTSPVTTVAMGTSVREAATLMVERHQHRVYVVNDGGEAQGVFSTKDVMTAVAGEKVKAPISRWMSSPIFTVRSDEPIALATERLEKAHVTGIVVVENGWPVGVFTQRESLLSADLERSTPVEEAMSPSLLCMHLETPTHRAAAQAAATTVRRVIATDGREMKGILTGLDFARAVL
ncbi:MAG: CBS domain-containing protein [Myxococcota bacterium]